ncbi:MAG: ABC transporter ATP-binding protein [Rickettsiales bacterium]|nr:ABC transporter ATP-binding protein [Pseudomonadota bacterium]MDA0966253.1 ABC transporter ATP-binding protein [Pseudomonadota bacterium]MDG4543082.1 ABC transporter ATP-binding protein [Rickettsiales bacterium]MDG4545280.1 ABC transporter ATP-binding protein [Rickettsiales bacterium]MDG4547729.1 ABC transporter ATP-binding protein [Rickettsiales bacterium]
MSSLVSVKNLHKDFAGFQAVKGVSFSVEKGQVLGFLGPNGAGKTTTMRMITGYLDPTSGNVKVGGVDVLENPLEAKRQIGYLPEGGPIYGDMTPASFLHFISKIRGLSDYQRKERMDFVVDKLGISDVFYKTIETLSKGYKRRVALAQAILHDPKVLILDEPTDGLDPNQKYDVRQLILQMAKEKAIVISTHILEEVDAVCTNAIIISEGEIVASGKPKELTEKDPANNAVYVRLYKAPADSILNDILQIKDVDRVNVENKNSVIAYPKKGKEILSSVASVMRKTEAPVETIYEMPGNLNDSFRNFTKSSVEK